MFKNLKMGVMSMSLFASESEEGEKEVEVEESGLGDVSKLPLTPLFDEMLAESPRRVDSCKFPPLTSTSFDIIQRIQEFPSVLEQVACSISQSDANSQGSTLMKGPVTLAPVAEFEKDMNESGSLLAESEGPDYCITTLIPVAPSFAEVKINSPQSDILSLQLPTTPTRAGMDDDEIEAVEESPPPSSQSSGSGKQEFSQSSTMLDGLSILIPDDGADITDSEDEPRNVLEVGNLGVPSGPDELPSTYDVMYYEQCFSWFRRSTRSSATWGPRP